VIVEELFELFKTPWEDYNSAKWYEMVLCSVDVAEELNTALTVFYGAEKRDFDSVLGIHSLPRGGQVELDWNGFSFPIYRNAAALEGEGDVFLRAGGSGAAFALKIDWNRQKIVRIGYDLFQEVDALLSFMQPAEYAGLPTLEIHIAILRELMVEAKVPFIEIRPVPYGYNISACLTHDIDFAGVRNHKFDHAMLGFLYRAVWRTLFDMLRGKATAHKLWKNLKAVASLPAVYMGFAKDFWVQFDGYREIERNLKSTFFFLPYKGKPGRGTEGTAPLKRACKYDIYEIRDHILKLASEGCEIGLHGIDAWRDSDSAREEAGRIASVTGMNVEGVRVHWLYFDQDSPRVLDKAGLGYDSTCGYNDGVGFRAGTAQAFRPPGCRNLLELPILIQDTAIFFPRRMSLAEDKAFSLCKKIIENVGTFGGVLGINWHDRSLAPERLWGDFYERLLNEIRSRKVWFGTGSEVTGWFRKRRNVKFKQVTTDNGTVKIRIEGVTNSGGPDLKLRLYGDWDVGSEVVASEKGYKEIPLCGDMGLQLTPAPLRQAQGH
jgi:hypothetical protein